jgi:hypothetical protein
MQTALCDSFSLSKQNNNSLANRMKAFVEDFTMLEWNWWPLKPRMRDMSSSETRLFWHCVSRHAMEMLHLTMCRLGVRSFGKRSPLKTQISSSLCFLTELASRICYPGAKRVEASVPSLQGSRDQRHPNQLQARNTHLVMKQQLLAVRCRTSKVQVLYLAQTIS